MTSPSLPAGSPRTAPGLASRFFGIITSPRATYEALVTRPVWFGMLALTTVTIIVLIGGFLLTHVGQEAWLEASSTSAFSGPVSDQQYQALQRMSGYAAYITAGSVLVMVPLVSALLAGVLFAIFNAALGGEGSYRQLLAIVVHTGPIGVLAQLFTVPLNYARGTMSSGSNLGVFTQALFDDGSLAARLLGMIDLFVIWQLIVLAIGLAVLFRRRTQPIATALLVTYFLMALVVAILRHGASA